MYLTRACRSDAIAASMFAPGVRSGGLRSALGVGSSMLSLQEREQLSQSLGVHVLAGKMASEHRAQLGTLVICQVLALRLGGDRYGERRHLFSVRRVRLDESQ